MIYSLRGKITLIKENFLVIDCNGVGYKCICSTLTLSSLQNSLHKDETVYTYLNVRQDSIELFGFYDTFELECFKLLISVSGVGPKVALGIFSGFTPEKLAGIISSEDIKSLTAAPGIGAKTAKRIILELKDKFGLVNKSSEIKLNEANENFGKKNEALNALMALGYSKSEVMPQLLALSENLSIEQMISCALKNMSKGG